MTPATSGPAPDDRVHQRGSTRQHRLDPRVGTAFEQKFRHLRRADAVQRRLLCRGHGVDEFRFRVEMLGNRFELSTFDLVEEVDGTFLRPPGPDLAHADLHLPPVRETVLDRTDLQGFDEGRAGWIEIGEARDSREPFTRFRETVSRLLG